MAKTKTKVSLEDRLQEARENVEALQQRIVQLEAELSSIPERIRSLRWDVESEADSLEQVGALEQRRLALPHLITALKSQACDAEYAALELEMEALEAQREPVESELAAKREAYQSAKAEYERASQAAHTLKYIHMSDCRQSMHRLKQRKAELEREATSSSHTAPIVRSVWTEQRPAEEDSIQDAPHLAFGAANVSDTPLSEGGGESEGPNVVVPEKALEQHSKRQGRKGDGGS